MLQANDGMGAGGANGNEAKSEAERLLAERLMEGEGERKPEDVREAAGRLPPRWEIRIRQERDPVAEETAVYRKLAKEVDERYDLFAPDDETKE